MSKKQQVKLCFKRESIDALNAVVKLKTIALASGRQVQTETYEFPESLQPVNLHPGLCRLKTVKETLKGISNERNIYVTLRDELVDKYLDEDLNLMFAGVILEELKPTEPESRPMPADASSLALDQSQTNSFLMQQISILQTQLKQNSAANNLNEAFKRFTCGEFDGSTDGKRFWASFEADCEKHRIDQACDKIYGLKMFIKDKVISWYDSSTIRLKNRDWTDWKAAFLGVYGPKNWSEVRRAYGFTWLRGSYRDYAIDKERLLLNIEETMTQSTVIDNIVIGLPIEVQAKLDREKLTTTVELLEELAKIPTPAYRASGLAEANKNRGIMNPQFNKIDKKPCSYCDSKGYPNRYHRVDQCRLKAEDGTRTVALPRNGDRHRSTRTFKRESNNLQLNESDEDPATSADESRSETENSGN